MEGHLDRKFLISTEAALRSIASVTDQLNASFNITTSGSLTGVSRLSAYLHLLHHQVRYDRTHLTDEVDRAELCSA